MPKITKLTRANINTLRNDMDAALASVLKTHGLTADLGRMTFSDSEVRCKLTVIVGTGSIESVATINLADERKFKQYASKFGLTGSEFGKSFKVRGKTFTIVRINPKAKVGGYPIIAKNANGTSYKFPASSAIEAV